MGTKRERGRILVGENDAAEAGVLKAALAAGGYDVCVAGESGGRGAFERSGGAGDGTRPYDVVVWTLEAGSPAQPERPSDPPAARALILLSAAGLLATAVEAERLGATAILSRPVDPAELRRVVDSALA